MRERRAEHGFLLTAWVFLPDHWHTLFFAGHTLTISDAVESVKVGATKRLNRTREGPADKANLAELCACF